MSLTPTQKEIAHLLIRRYCERAEANRENIHYRQFRPMNHFGKSPNGEWTADCSGFVTGAFRWADIFTKFAVQDPNGLHYSGYGNTATLLSRNRTGHVPLWRKFFVGDMALYGPSLGDTRHVVICRKAGDRHNAIWTSHGSEAAPYPVYLNYRRDLLLVVRAADLR